MAGEHAILVGDDALIASADRAASIALGGERAAGAA
jgi:hypothetical protein